MIAAGEYALTYEQGRSEAEVDLAGLVAEYGPLLFRVAYSVLRSRSEAEDAVQDALVRVLEHRSELPQVRHLRVWLVRIAWNKALDRRRRKRPEQMDEEFAGMLAAKTVPADQAFSEAQTLSRLLAAIEKLPKLEREVLLLSAVEELSASEIAQVVGRSESATRALLFRARTRLKQRGAKGDRR